MKNLGFTLLIIVSLGVLPSSSAASLPSWHVLETHRCAMIVVPPSEHPLIIKVTDAQQQVFLYLTLDASNGAEKKIDFSAMPTGHYFLEVHYNHQTFHKLVQVHPNWVKDQDASTGFRLTQHYQF